jgi:hypothetical protein
MINNSSFSNKKRCFECNKKIGLCSIQCRCLQYFCGLHRYKEQHKCVFDYKIFEKKKLYENIIKCISDKVDYI